MIIMAISGVTDYRNTYAANYAGATKGAKDTAPAQQTTEEYISGLEKKYGIKISLVDFTNEKQSDAYVFGSQGGNNLALASNSGDNEAEWEEMDQAKNNYYKTLKKEDRVAAAWTLGQLEISIGRKAASAIKEKVPGWTHGRPIPSDVLDEIFADESITSMVSGEAKGLDMKI